MHVGLHWCSLTVHCPKSLKAIREMFVFVRVRACVCVRCISDSKSGYKYGWPCLTGTDGDSGGSTATPRSAAQWESPLVHPVSQNLGSPGKKGSRGSTSLATLGSGTEP